MASPSSRIRAAGASRSRPRFAERRRKTMPWRSPHPSVFSILVVFEPHDIALQLSGTLAEDSCLPLAEAVTMALGEQPRRLVLELSALDAIDGAGVDEFVLARKHAGEVGVELVVDSPNDAVREQLDAADAIGGWHIR
jgi:anti-anti-sigma regulatory factor